MDFDEEDYDIILLLLVVSSVTYKSFQYSIKTKTTICELTLLTTKLRALCY